MGENYTTEACLTAFLIHGLFSFKNILIKKKKKDKKNLAQLQAPCRRKSLTPTLNVSDSAPVIRSDIEWLSTRGSGTVSTAFSPRLEFSCLANFNSLVESSIQFG